MAAFMAATDGHINDIPSVGSTASTTRIDLFPGEDFGVDAVEPAEGIDSSYQDKKSNSPLTAMSPNSSYLDRGALHRKIEVRSNWTTFDEQPLSGESIAELFSNAIPAIRHPKLLSTEECARLVHVIKTAQVVSLSS